MKVTDLRIHNEIDVVFRNGETVRKVFHLVEVGEDDRDFVAALDGPLAQAEGGCLRSEVHGDLLALALDAAVLGVLDRVGELIDVVHLARADQIARDDDGVVRLGPHRVVGR